MSTEITFGYWLRRRRKALDLTQAQLADMVGCAPVTIRMLEAETRRPSAAMAERLAACLGLAGDERAGFLRASRSAAALDELTPPSAEPLGMQGRAHASVPAPATRLIGRGQALAELRALLRRPGVRLVSMTGPGGVGKTRLALAVAAELAPELPDGAAFVSLAVVGDPALAIPTVVQSLGLPETGTYPALERLTLALGRRHMLLILDGAERVAAAAPQLAELLAGAPRLTILVTSRVALRLSAEHEYAVAPLALPRGAEPADAQPPQTVQSAQAVQAIRGSAAVELFVERARAVRPGFALTEANAAHVAAICARLDGLPLAIELAAARVALLTPQALLERLAHRLTLLVGGPRDLPARQQTMRATLDWSFGLLGPGERELLARLSVFVGGFSLEAAAEVCGEGLPVEAALERLIDHSLVAPAESAAGDGEPRFAMLELIREYAGEQLSDGPAVAARHAACFLRLAREAAPHLLGPDQAAWADRLQRDWPNLRAALEWGAAAPEDPERSRLLAELAVALWWFWYLRGYHEEGAGWLAQAAACAAAPQAAARAGYCAGALAYRQGDYARAAALAGASLAACERIGDDVGAAFARGVLALSALLRGDPAAAAALALAARPALEREGHTWALAVSQTLLGTAARFRGETAESLALLAEGLRLFRQIGDLWGTATALGEQALTIALSDGDWARAGGMVEESLALFRRAGDSATAAHALHRLGRAARKVGRHRQAAELLGEQAALARRFGDQAGLAYALWEAAALAAALGRMRQAALLLGAAAARSAAIGLALSVDSADYARLADESRAAIGDAAFAAADSEGRGLGPEAALAALAAAAEELAAAAG